MKKIFAYSFAAALAVFAVSCQSENLDPQTVTDEQIQPVQMITETITATADEGNTKATVDADAKFAWTAGDNIAVHVSNGASYKYVLTSDTGASGASASAASASFTVVYEEGYARDAFAVFPASIVATDAANYGQSGQTLDVTLPGTYALSAVSGENTPCPMIADNTGSGWEFKQLCGLLRLTVSDIPSGTSYLKLDFNGRKVSGAFSVASPVTAGTSTIASVAGTKGTDDFIKITGITTETSVTVNIPLPTGTAYSDLIVSALNVSDVPLKAQVTPFSYTASRAKGKKLTSALSLGVFSIASGKYAVFAPGNLQYNKSTDTWSFMDNQYDMAETASQNVGTDYASQNIVSLFGWGTKTKPYNTTTVDNYNTSASYDVDYSWNEWGDNVIDGYAAGTWRTLTGGSGAEWAYLLNTDGSSSGRSDSYRFQRATVTASDGTTTIAGLLIFPDGYTTQVTGDNTGLNQTGDGYPFTQKTYSNAEWLTLESNGVVFLPAAGYRSGTTVTSDVGTYAYYWSSTIGDNGVAKCVNFSSITLSAESAFYRGNGCSVRLVHPVE